MLIILLSLEIVQPKLSLGKTWYRHSADFVGTQEPPSPSQESRREKHHFWGDESLLLQRHVPVGLADESRPGLDADLFCRINRSPLGASRAPPQPHSRLFGGTIPLSAVAVHTGQDAILPGRFPSPCPWDDVINCELIGWELLSAVLAGVVIPFEEIPPAERDPGVRHSIEFPQGNDFGHSQSEGDALNEALTVCRCQLCPIGPAISAKVFWIDYQGCPLIDQDQGPGNRRHVDGLPISIEHQRGPLKYTTRHSRTYEEAVPRGSRKPGLTEQHSIPGHPCAA